MRGWDGEVVEEGRVWGGGGGVVTSLLRRARAPSPPPATTQEQPVSAKLLSTTLSLNITIINCRK